MSEVALTVSGMSCPGCEQRVSRVEGQTGTVVVDYDPATVDTPALSRRLEDAGYEVIEEEAKR